MHTGRRAALYVRLSEDRRQTGDNVADQKAAGRKVAESLGAEVVAIYDDNDRVASDPKRRPRPEFDRMLADAEAGLFDLLVVRHADRLYRTPHDQQRVSEAFKTRRIVIHQEWSGYPLDLSTPTGIMQAGILAQVAQYETQHKSERQKATNRARAAKGEAQRGGPVPFGYHADRVTVHPETGQMVRDAYKALLSGSSLGSVIRLWNDSKYTAPRGGRWSYSTVRGVLLRALNCGLIQYDGVVLTDKRGEWEPLVSEEDYYGLKAVLENPARRTTTGRARKHLLVGLISCESCDKTMKSGSVRSRGRQSLLYRCGNPDCAKPLAVAREQVNEHVVGRFLTERGSLRTTRLVTEDNGAALADIEARIAGVTARMGQDGVNAVDLMERLDKLKVERASLRSSTGSMSVSSERVAQEWVKAVTVVEKAELLRSHLVSLSVAPRGKTSHRFDPERVTIVWADVPDSTLDGRPLVKDEDPQGSGLIGPVVLRIGDSVTVVSRPMSEGDELTFVSD